MSATLPQAIELLIGRLAQGDASAAVGCLRAVRSGDMSRVQEAAVVDALYEARRAFKAQRFQFALSQLCARTGTWSRERAILLELAALEYPPALHMLGLRLAQTGRIEAGVGLIQLARESGYHFGEVQYWWYSALQARGWRRVWMLIRAAIARAWPKPKPKGDDDGAFWLPE